MAPDRDEDELLVELRALGIGCKVAGVYMGAVGFCDDLLLLAPTRDGMHVMIDTCERFAKSFNLQFSTDPDPTKLAVVPDRDRWRVSYLERLLEERGQAYYEGGDCEHLTVLIDSLCTN